MAKLVNKQNLENVPGLFFVDNACIDCDLCRQTAPKFFKRYAVGGNGHSYMAAQPVSQYDLEVCEAAMEACPVEAIGKQGVEFEPATTVWQGDGDDSLERNAVAA